MVSESFAYGLVLVAAVAHAIWSAIVKNSGDRLLMLAAIRAVGLVAGLSLAICVPLPSAESLPFLFAAAAVHYVYYMLMLGSYRIGDMSQVYPIARGVAPLAVLFLGALFADETLDFRSLIAVCVLSLGIAMLALSGRVIGSKAFALAVLTGLAISAYSFLSGMGVRRTAYLLSYVAWLEIATGIGMVAAAGLRRKNAVLVFARTQWRTGLTAGVLSVAGYAIVLWAMSRVAMAPVVALRETSIVFAALIGSLFLREGFALPRTGSAVLVVVGVLMLGVGVR